MRSWMIAFSTGMLLASLVPRLPPVHYFPLLLIIPLLSWRAAWLRLSGAYCLGLLWFLLWAWEATESLLPETLEREDIWVRGVISSLPEAGQFNTSFHFKVEQSCIQAKLSQCSFEDAELQGQMILLSVYQEIELAPGQRWLFQVRLKRPHGFQNPGGFDYEAWLWQQKIRATGYVREHPSNRLLETQDRGFQQLRHHFRQTLTAVFADQELRFMKLIRALSIGDRQGLSSSDWDLFSATGTNHLVVISGMHLGFVALLFFALGRAIVKKTGCLCLIIPAPRLAALLGLVATYCYAQLAGFGLPVQRALVMAAAFMLGMLICRQRSIYDSYCLALALVLALNPLAGVSSGFWLSFAAVAVLIFFARRQEFPVGLIQRLFLLLKSQLMIFLGLLPFMLFIFQQSSLAAPLVNLLAIPYITLLIVPLCLLALVLSTFSESLLFWLGTVLDWLLGLFMAFLTSVASAWSQSLLLLPALSPWQWGLFLLAMTGSLLALQHKARLCIPGLALASLLLFLPTAEKIKTGQFQIDILDVGQGLALLIRTRNHVLLYDTGPRYSDSFNAGEAAVLPFLQRQNIDELDRVIVSHGDNDHAGGLVAIRRRFPTADLLAGESENLSYDRQAGLCRSGQQWQWDAVHFEILHPDREAYRGNNASCVLRVSNAGFAVLLPGDIESQIERLLIAGEKKLQSDILVAPHHGSRSSSHAAFVRAVSPDYVIFSSGYLNQFNHPHPQIVNLYTNSGTISLNTAETGAISWLIPEQGELPAPELYRQTHRRLWR